MKGHFVKGFSSFTCFRTAHEVAVLTNQNPELKLSVWMLCIYIWKMCNATFLALFYCAKMTLHELVACSQMMCTFTRLCMCVCVFSPPLPISRGSFTTLVDSSLNVTQYWKTTPPCTSKEPLHRPWSCRNVTVSTRLDITLERRDYICTWRLLPLNIPHSHVLNFVCLALNGPLLLLLPVICLCITHCWSQSLIDSLCLVCIVNCKRLFT